MFTNKRFILASTSKSRYKILKQNKLSFLKKKPTCKEGLIKKKLIKNKKKPIQIVKTLAKEKAKSVSKKYEDDLVVGCDTIILFKNNIIGKARTLSSAHQKLLALSGKTHKIISSVSVYKNKKQIWSHTQTTSVELRKTNTKEIKKYLKLCGKNILSSAGCYQIEAQGPNIIKKIKGDFFNVMGFPLFPFLNFLKKFHIKK